MIPIREPVPGMIIAGYRCCDCRSCDRWGTCHVRRRYVGRWTRACTRLRLSARAAAEAAEGGEDARISMR